MRQTAALETAELGLVLDRVRRLESEFLDPTIVRRPLLFRQTCLATGGFHPLELSDIGKLAIVLPVVWSMGVKEGHGHFLKG
jgi:hypothetical protein